MVLCVEENGAEGLIAMILCRAVLWDLLDDLEFGWYLVVMSRE
jgi:hypothetical protein